MNREWRFEQVDPPGERFVMAPSARTVTAGRHAQCDLVVVHGSISRNHARLYRRDDRLFVEDLNSTNGVSVNGERIIAPHEVKSGDAVTFGEVCFRVTDAAVAETKPQAVVTRTAIQPGLADRPERVQRLEMLIEMSRLINSSLVPSEVLERVMDAVMKMTGAERGFLMIADQDDALGCRVARNMDRDALNRGEVRVSMSTVRRAFADGRSFISVDVDHDDRISTQDSVLYLGLKSVMVVPLKNRDLVFGVIYVDSQQVVRSFTAEDLGILETLATHTAIAITNARLVEESNEMLFSTIEALAEAIEKRDTYTGGHTRRVVELSIEIADELCVSPEDRENLLLGALLHDIGKIGVEDRVLRKEGPLDREESKLIQAHPRVGRDIVKHIRRLESAIPAILMHHERFDGSGYPDGSSGTSIPLIARIIAVADSVDAMMTDRPYRKGLPLTAVLAELEKFRGLQFDPGVADAAVRILKRKYSPPA